MVHFVEDGGESDRIAPVIPLFPGSGERAPARPGGRRVMFEEMPEPEHPGSSDTSPEPADPATIAAGAEKALVRKLAARELSVVEARTFLVEREVADDEIERILGDFVDRRYLDDARLAEQIVRIGTERKGQGRQVIAMTLSSRGVPRDVADAALDAMPDDEAERALAFARDRARRLDGVDETAALRRLLGQLARRGYGGSAATEAARQALAERRGSSSGVRFD